MDISFLFRGALIGFSVAAPVGPVGILCIRRSLHNGFRTGLYTGLGAATADALYGAIAAFGLTFISMLLLQVQVWLAFLGGALLLHLGIKGILAKPAADEVSPGNQTKYAGVYLSTLVLTLTNPATIFSFLPIFAGAGLTSANGFSDAVAMVMGVFVGSAVWWLFLSYTVSALKHRFDARYLRATNLFAGVLMIGYGLYVLFNGMSSLWSKSLVE